MRPKLDEAGTSGAGGSGTGTPPLPAQQPTTPPTAPNSAPAQAPAAAPAATGHPEGYVPIDQFRAVTEERNRLNREKEEAETKRQTEQGEWQKVAEKHEAKSKEFESKFLATARRAAFVAAAAKDGKVADPMAAYKLALTDGLLNDVKVDDEGNADDTTIAAALKKTTDTYGFLKANASFGGERGGTQPESSSFDPDKADSRTLLREGFRRAGIQSNR